MVSASPSGPSTFTRLRRSSEIPQRCIDITKHRILVGFHSLWYTRNTKNGKYFGWTGNPVPACIRGFFSGEAGDGARMAGQKKSDSLRGQVYQELRSALRKGKIGSSRMATERDLAEQLGVSRTPVREALALLVHEGLISSTSRGFTPPEVSREDLADLYEIRRLLEPAALATTLDHLSTHDFRMLRQFLGEQEAADTGGDAVAFVEANSNFRSVWLGAVPNKQLRALIERHRSEERRVGKECVQ